jgi:putative addiction module antidote
MSDTVVVRKVGNSAGVTLAKELLEVLNVSVGEKLHVIRTPYGIQLTAYDPDFAKVLESTRDYMKRHRNAMQELARK